MQIWHLHEVQDRSSGVGPEGQRELRPSFASPGVCMCLTAMSSCRVTSLNEGAHQPAMHDAVCVREIGRRSGVAVVWSGW